MRHWLLHKLHISWLVSALCCGLLVGVAYSPVSPRILSHGATLAIALITCIICGIRRQHWTIVLIAISGGLIGVWRGAAEWRQLDAYEPLYGQYLELRGVLREDIAVGPKGDQRFELQDIYFGGHRLHGKVWASTAQPTTAKRGDWLVMRGVLGEGFGSTTATMARTQVIRIERANPPDRARVVRDKFAESVRLGIDDPQAALGIGYLTGQRSSLPPELNEQLQVVGLTHAVVASGYNLTILVSFTRNMLAGFSKYMATLAACLLVAAFMLVTGFSPSMVRAGLVSGLSLAVWYFGRVIHPLVLLPFAAAITVILQPSYAWGDIGWCLSFAAFAGIIIVAPLIRRYFWPRNNSPPFILNLVIDTSAAQLTTLPVILYAFGQLATFSLVANLLVLPLVPLAMAMTFITGLAGLILPQFVGVAGLPAEWLLTYMIWIINRIAELPGAQQPVPFNMLHLIVSYILLFLVCMYLWRRTGLDFRKDEDRQDII